MRGIQITLNVIKLSVISYYYTFQHTTREDIFFGSSTKKICSKRTHNKEHMKKEKKKQNKEKEWKRDSYDRQRSGNIRMRMRRLEHSSRNHTLRLKPCPT